MIKISGTTKPNDNRDLLIELDSKVQTILEQLIVDNKKTTEKITLTIDIDKEKGEFNIVAS